jgi:endonuclease/exonuclease/phosphatase family metal-dependent hydrolase
MTSHCWEVSHLKIATWNVERLKHKSKLPQMIEVCNQIAADIFVLTETDAKLNLNHKHCFRTQPLTDTAVKYDDTENRVTICTHYELVEQHVTFDEQTAVCVELMTDHGNLLVYGVVIGIYGNRHENFKTDLPKILADIERFAADGKHLCVCGDFNCSFSDNYYYTKEGRAAFEDAFVRADLELLTRNQPECIDHIAVSRNFIGTSSVRINEWNCDKKLSDHKGIVAELIR